VLSGFVAKNQLDGMQHIYQADFKLYNSSRDSRCTNRSKQIHTAINGCRILTVSSALTAASKGISESLV
jgi:hypothetical protein